jgi:hypothetical protein
MRLTKNVLAFVAGAVLAALPAAAADLTIVFKVTGVDGKASTATDYYTRGKFRSGDGTHDTIVDVAGGRIVTVDHARKEYTDMAVAEIEATVKAAREQMDAAMKDMPPAMREKMAQMMGGGDVKVTPGSGSRTIAGYATQPYVIAVGPAQTETWIATALTPPMEPGEIMRLQSLANSAGKSGGNAVEEFKKIKGVSLATISTASAMGRTITTSREATEVKTGPVPASAFEIPAGYRQVESPLAKMRKR